MDHTNRKLNIPYKTAFVVNPTSGAGHAGKTWPQIAAVLDQSGQQYKVYFTHSSGDGKTLAAKAVKEGAELVVAVGGDGTLFEVVNGINPDQTVFAVIPLGTGNGFRRSCALPGHWQAALLGLGSWQPRRIDLGMINGTYFLNVAGIGFDAAVAEMASEKYKIIKGYTAYVVAFFDELTHFDHFNTRIKCDQWEIDQPDTLLVLVANGSYYGGGFTIAPQAEIDDGQLDLIIIRKLNNPETTLLAFQAMVGKHLDHSAVITTKIDRFTVEADHQVPMHIDGEVIGKLPVEIGIKPGALQIIAPPKTYSDC
ncbi:MAG: diacylglycerol kinase family lipid kinase [Firmicutes bacterium]|nr:diacylglycerol kinase family lipid kinase [Bacillota bacterium]